MVFSIAMRIQPFSKEDNKTGLGLSLRDEVGVFVAAETAWITPVLQPREGEALAQLCASKWCAERRVCAASYLQD